MGLKQCLGIGVGRFNCSAEERRDWRGKNWESEGLMGRMMSGSRGGGKPVRSWRVVGSLHGPWLPVERNANS